MRGISRGADRSRSGNIELYPAHDRGIIALVDAAPYMGTTIE